MKGRVALLLLAAVLAGFLWLRHLASPPAPPRAEAASPSEDSEAVGRRLSPVAASPAASPLITPRPPITSASAAETPPASATGLDEPAVMDTLRQLGDSAPTFSLALAREANRQYPNSADAAERGFYICKSLVNLERFLDARAEARLMVEQFRGTAWASDVERHLLVNPFGPPPDATR